MAKLAFAIDLKDDSVRLGVLQWFPHGPFPLIPDF